MLKWPQRMAITIGLTRGVQFLHTGVAPGIYGNNLKINNILLDESLSAKISSYNIPLPSKVEMVQNVSEISEVYGFSVVIKCCFFNFSGWVGEGSTRTRFSPRQVLLLSFLLFNHHFHLVLLLSANFLS